MDGPKQQEHVYTINPARLPRDRYFQKRLKDIQPRMRRIIEREPSYYEKDCQQQMNAIDSRIIDTSKSPTIRVVTYGDEFRTKDSLLQNIGNEAEKGPQFDDLGRVLVVWTTAVRGKRKFEDILTRCVVPTLKKCYYHSDNRVEQVTPVVLCVEYGGLPMEKDNFRKVIVKHIKKTKELAEGFDSDRHVVIVNANAHTFGSAANELEWKRVERMKDTTTTLVDQDSEEAVKTRPISPSSPSRMRSALGNIKHSPPKSPESVHSPIQTDSVSASTSRTMDVAKVPNNGDEQICSCHGPVTRIMRTFLNETKGNDAEREESLGQSSTGTQLATEDTLSKELDLKQRHFSLETKLEKSAQMNQATSPSKRVFQQTHDVADETVLLDAISYQLETIHIRTLEMIEEVVNKMNNKPAGEEDVTTILDKLLFEVAGVFYQSITKEGERRKYEAEKNKLSEKLTGDLLRVQHVSGCGRMYGKLQVHIDTTCNEPSVKQSIKHVLKQHNYKYSYEVKSVILEKQCIAKN